MRSVAGSDAGRTRRFALLLVMRLVALMLVFSFFIPTLTATAHDAPATHALPHAFEMRIVDSSGTSGAQGGCCAECLQHAFYRHVDDAAAIAAGERRSFRQAFAISDESASSLNIAPTRKPPRI